MAQKKISQLPQDTAPTTTDSIPTYDVETNLTKRATIADLITLFFNNIPAGAHSDVTRGGETLANFVASGGVWSGDAYASTRNASMTALICYINGRRISIGAVTARTFTASKDTYIDVLDNQDGTGTLVYTEVTNNAASPSLAANSIRIGIVVTGATTIAASTSISQSGYANTLPTISSQILKGNDTLGNIIFPKGPGSPKLAQNPYKFRVHQVTAQNSSAGAFVKLNLDTKDFDTGNNVDVVTNRRFTAPVAGYYFFNGHGAVASAPGLFMSVALYKNGAEYKRGVQQNATNAAESEVSDVIQMAANDYIELYLFTSSAVAIVVNTPEQPVLSGFLISAS